MTRLVLMLCVATLAWPNAAPAQDGAPGDQYDSDPPAHIAVVEGSAVLERDGRVDSSPSSMPLVSGDRVRTFAGRVEILFGDGSTLHLDANTTMDFQSDELVRLLSGRIRLSIPGPAREVSYRVDAPFAWARFSQPGEYRMAILSGEREAEIELAVLRGAAELSNEDGRTPLRAGERAFSRSNAAPSLAYVFNSASWDAFDRWVEARHDQRRAVSTQYLPEPVRPYADSFDRYGSWRQEPSYGYVWYPTVSVGWRPYYNGRWETLRPYGWTWIGSDAWAWPTHHYGRWGVSAGVWFWIPGRRWAPAWVSWAYAPGYVSWCPLGWNNRPVVQVVNVNIYNRGYDPWRAWTAVPRRHFDGRYVNVRGTSVGVFDARTRGAFVAGGRAPDHGAYAVQRESAPIRGAGTGRRREGSSPVYSNLESRDARVSGPSRTMVPQRTPDAQGSRDRSDVAASGGARASIRAVPPEAGTAPDTRDTQARRSSNSPPSAGGATAAPRTGNRYEPIERDDSRRRVLTEQRGYGTTPAPPARQDDSPAVRSTPAPYGVTRSTPRSGVEQREPAGRRQPDSYSAPGGVGAAPRAAPRESVPGAPAGGYSPRAPSRESAPPPVQRQSPGVERRSSAPERQSGPPPAGAPSRPRSGGQSTGTAVRRPGGG